MAIFAAMPSADGVADPADDALAKMQELSRQSEQTTEAMHSAQLDLDAKLAAQKVAEDRHAADLAVLRSVEAQRATAQAAVDKVAAAIYTGARTDVVTAVMTASAPQQLIDQILVQQVVGAQMAAQLAWYRHLNAKAAAAVEASAKSAEDARIAAEQAAAVRTDLQAKQSQLLTEINAVQTQYSSLTPEQRAALAALAAPARDALLSVPGPPPGAVSPGGAAVVQAALSRTGSPYVWGAEGPNAFDCSGLIVWAFRQIGKSLPHSSQAIAAGGQPVPLDQVQPGDIVTYYSDASHDGIYIGDGQIVHASTFGVPVGVVPVDKWPIYNIRRY